MKSLFDQATFSEIQQRLNNLSEDSPRQWGKMSPGQMLHHCQGPLNIMLGNDKPFRENLPTARFLKETEPRDFNTSKDELVSLLNEFEGKKEQTTWDPHPGFGKFTQQQWGQMQYKHLDHHLKQFNV